MIVMDSYMKIMEFEDGSEFMVINGITFFYIKKYYLFILAHISAV